ncbi:MMPL family transporter [Streptomyces sp. BH-SS-21]|uniref:MMPL family transporter n=1 Tax=Streptomyces liliiviolaceus TaxID=2823109 RepID=A0A940Y259_9ACTN|nr:MMPL family transporter [Streptomyces liliiviolaceus]MBQ0850980.1 MMPL family transporter [Streptomyces liliiviolaceus]
MFASLARLARRRSRLVLYLSGVLFVVAGALGGSVLQELSAGGFVDDSTESAHTAKAMDDRFGAGAPDLVLLVSDERGVDSPAVAAAGARLTARVAREPGVEQAVSYWSLGKAEPLRGKDGQQALVMARISGDEDQVQDTFERLENRYRHTSRGLDVRVGGHALADKEMSETTEKDLLKIEAVTFPVLLVVMLFVFRSVVAALVPLLVSGLTILSVLLVIRVLTLFTEVSALASNVATGLGLGLAIDYSLILIKRYREERDRGAGTDQALTLMLRTAGRTVLFSSVTVTLALAALLVFPFYYLRSFAYAGIPTALLAAVVSLTFLPALLKVLDHRIEKGRLPGRRSAKAAKAAARSNGGRAAGERAAEEGFWHRLAMGVMRFPLPVAGAVVALLLLLGAPFLGLRLSLPDERVLPADSQARQVGGVLRDNFRAQETQALNVVLSDTPGPGARRVAPYAERLSGLDGVARVDSEAGTFAGGRLVQEPSVHSARFGAEDSTYLSVVPRDQSMSEQGRELVEHLRGLPAPYAVQVGGPAAELTDSIDSMNARLPAALAVIAVSSFVVLFLFTGSLLLPLKALVLNCLSLSATLGVLVWGFQEGHLQGVVGDFVVTDSITWTVPLLLFCLAFGLSMDYEVFLLSRIKEEYDRTGDNTASVARGLERTGSMITAAAVLISIVFLGFLISGIVYLKAIGLGLALAVLMDATLVRGLLVPAFMRLVGKGNWWAPKPLRALHARAGLRERGP